MLIHSLVCDALQGRVNQQVPGTGKDGELVAFDNGATKERPRIHLGPMKRNRDASNQAMFGLDLQEYGFNL